MPVPVLLEPVERGTCCTRTVEARRAHQDDLISCRENPTRRGLENARAGVETDEVVVAFEEFDRTAELLLTNCARDLRVVVGSDDLEASRRLRRVSTDI